MKLKVMGELLPLLEETVFEEELKAEEEAKACDDEEPDETAMVKTILQR